MNIAVFASGRGTNFSAIAKGVKSGRIKAILSLLVCDNPKAGVIARAKRAGVKIALVKREGFRTKKDFEEQIIQHLRENKIDLIVMAGYMRILGREIINRYRNKILNIHPALLPSFKGANGIKDAFDYGVKVTGVTVHFVDEKMDNGPIILQEPVKIKGKDTLKSLEGRVHEAEHKIYPKAAQLYVEGKLKIKGRKVVVSAL